MDLVLAQPRGFCAGVVRAIDIVELALEIHGAPIYVLHEIVHNHFVVNDLKQKGAIFVETLEEIPAGEICIFSAHGVADRVVSDAEFQGLRVIDATCPLVTKVHLQAQRYSKKGYTIIIIGHEGHVEVEGTKGSVDGPVHVLCTEEEVQQLQIEDPERVAYVTQTTLSIDDTREVIEALKKRFPAVQGPELSDICYATQNRQNAVHELSDEVDLLLVVGARNSSNSNRLREVGTQHDIPSYLISDADAIDDSWLDGVSRVGITAGASAPEILVQGVIDHLKTLGIQTSVSDMEGEAESTTFRLPKTELLVRADP
jgi:4-hydroxy-3-methylbut-2-enyl diphosphate reductase